jgi:hypothetical protein
MSVVYLIVIPLSRLFERHRGAFVDMTFNGASEGQRSRGMDLMSQATRRFEICMWVDQDRILYCANPHEGEIISAFDYVTRRVCVL